jgi:SAM-dependent methyltransferase
VTGAIYNVTWRAIQSEFWCGKSLARTHMNLTIPNTVSIKGIVFDVGGGESPSYLRILDTSATDRLVVVDINPYRGAIHIAGSVDALPLRTRNCDAVLCFNLLEHVLDHKAALAEIWRVLRPSGTLYGYVPFLDAVHSDPSDHWRYMQDTLNVLLRQAGFAADTVSTQGGLSLVMFDLLAPLWRWRPIRLIAASIALVADYLFASLRAL